MAKQLDENAKTKHLELGEINPLRTKVYGPKDVELHHVKMYRRSWMEDPEGFPLRKEINKITHEEVVLPPSRFKKTVLDFYKRPPPTP